MQIIINTTPETVQDYAAFVYTGITDGETSGHYDASNHWSIIPDNTENVIQDKLAAYLFLVNNQTSDESPEVELAAWDALVFICQATGIPMPTGAQANARMDAIAARSN